MTNNFLSRASCDWLVEQAKAKGVKLPETLYYRLTAQPELTFAQEGITPRIWGYEMDEPIPARVWSRHGLPESDYCPAFLPHEAMEVLRLLEPVQWVTSLSTASTDAPWTLIDRGIVLTVSETPAAALDALVEKLRGEE